MAADGSGMRVVVVVVVRVRKIIRRGRMIVGG